MNREHVFQSLTVYFNPILSYVREFYDAYGKFYLCVKVEPPNYGANVKFAVGATQKKCLVIGVARKSRL
jgi:hypothetical protein